MECVGYDDMICNFLFLHFHVSSSRRYEEDMYWRRMEEEQLYWVEMRHRMAPPPLMGRPNMPVPPLLVRTHNDISDKNWEDASFYQIVNRNNSPIYL